MFLVFHCAAKKKLKPQTPKTQKKLEFFFWFFTILYPSFYEKTKNLEIFSLFKVKTKKKTKKKTRQNQKKTNMSLRPNILLKVLVFCFFGFLEVFYFVNGVFPKSLQTLFFVGFRSSSLFAFIALFPTCFDSVHSYYPQDIFKK